MYFFSKVKFHVFQAYICQQFVLRFYVIISINLSFGLMNTNGLNLKQVSECKILHRWVCYQIIKISKFKQICSFHVFGIFAKFWNCSRFCFLEQLLKVVRDGTLALVFFSECNTNHERAKNIEKKTNLFVLIWSLYLMLCSFQL